MTGLPFKPPLLRPEQRRGWVMMSHRAAELEQTLYRPIQSSGGFVSACGPRPPDAHPGGDPRWSNLSRPRRETREHYQADLVGGAVEHHRTTNREPTR